ncbi:MAG: hypothetical protein A2171_00960 [Candidatus Levybacteria bacterium RBG_13_35_9]|nr:MAG: hypothetical protein A2171_00960 [Candidatus Levybacteria bacterium RBG_13_35_9]
MIASSELDNRPSDLQKRLDVIAELEGTELEGHHVDSLMEKVDPTKDKAIAHNLENLNPAHHSDIIPFGFERFGALIRKNRREISRLLRHR